MNARHLPEYAMNVNETKTFYVINGWDGWIDGFVLQKKSRNTFFLNIILTMIKLVCILFYFVWGIVPSNVFWIDLINMFDMVIIMGIMHSVECLFVMIVKDNMIIFVWINFDSSGNIIQKCDEKNGRYEIL